MNPITDIVLTPFSSAKDSDSTPAAIHKMIEHAAMETDPFTAPYLFEAIYARFRSFPPVMQQNKKLEAAFITLLLNHAEKLREGPKKAMQLEYAFMRILSLVDLYPQYEWPKCDTLESLSEHLDEARVHWVVWCNRAFNVDVFYNAVTDLGLLELTTATLKSLTTSYVEEGTLNLLLPLEQMMVQKRVTELLKKILIPAKL